MCASLATVYVTNHTWACKCHSALGSLGDSYVLCRPKFKNQKGEDPIAAGKASRKKPKKTKHKILYAQVYTYIPEKDYRSIIHCIASSTMDMQHSFGSSGSTRVLW